MNNTPYVTFVRGIFKNHYCLRSIIASFFTLPSQFSICSSQSSSKRKKRGKMKSTYKLHVIFSIPRRRSWKHSGNRSRCCRNRLLNNSYSYNSNNFFRHNFSVIFWANQSKPLPQCRYMFSNSCENKIVGVFLRNFQRGCLLIYSTCITWFSSSHCVNFTCHFSCRDYRLD